MYGPEMIKEVTVAVGAGATVYSEAVNLTGLDSFALEYQAACTGSPNVKLVLQQSSDGTNWSTPDNVSPSPVNESLTDEVLHSAQLQPLTLAFLRLKVIEQTTTVADTVIMLKLSGQKKHSA